MDEQVFHGTAAEKADALHKADLEYFVEIGRRAPMTCMHVDCILEGVKAGLRPVIFIGSINGPDSPLYNPVLNPLTVGQQKEQFRHALKGIYYSDNRVLTMEDVGDNATWAENVAHRLEEAGLAGRSVVHFRSKSDDKPKPGSDIKPMTDSVGHLVRNGIPVWHSYNTNPEDDHISASKIRTWDLDNLTAEQRGIIAAPDYLVSIVKDARAQNPDRDLLEKYNIPLTTLDLTLDRMRKEAGLPTCLVVDWAECLGPMTAETLTSAASDVVRTTRSPRPQFSKNAGVPEFTLKIASASCNQTGGDWARNLGNIFTAIDKAVEDGADVLALEELGLTGYDRGDDFQLSDNKETRRLLQDIADYAAAKDPNLIVSVGHPWHFADKNIQDQHDRVKNPLFNAEDKQFNVQTLITGGEIVSMSAKSYLFGYERGYEPRWFMQWEDNAANRYAGKHGKGRDGTLMIDIPAMAYEDGTVLPEKTIPFGSPVVQFEDEAGVKMNVFQNICHGKWVASRFEGLPDNSRYDLDNPLAQKAQRFDITLCLNPNASPPAANKIDKHYELDTMASKHCGVFVDTDGLGTSGSTFAQFGTRLMAQDGKIVSEGVRLTFADVGYTSQTVTLKSAAYKGHQPHTVIRHAFKAKHTAPVQDGPAPWEKGPRREMEEEVRNEILWQYDYERKCGLSAGIFEALSGGNDSCYNSVVRAYLKVEAVCAELGVEGYIKGMSDGGREPAWAAEARQALAEKGEKAAKRVIMDNTLTCVFMGTDNSDAPTLRAAKTLIEGGLMEDGTYFEGIGGKFHTRNVQRLVEVYAMIYAGVDTKGMTPEREAEIRTGIADILRLRPEKITQDELEHRVDVLKSTFEEVAGDVLSYARPRDQLPYENIQARLRQVLGAVFYGVEGKLGVANPNLDEMTNSYATYGGDAHGGMIAGNAHKGKQREIDHMRLLYEHGLEGAVAPVKALHFTLKNRPSAGLQPLGEDGKTQQFDEDQLGRSFAQMDVLRVLMLGTRPLEKAQRRLHPVEVFEKARHHDVFAHDDIETLHDRVLLNYARWGGNAQAKIHAGPISLTYGENVDHQTSLRTPNISANQKPEQTAMTLHCLAEMAARDGMAFEQLTGGRTLAALTDRALKDKTFGARLASKMWTPEANDGRKMKIGTLYAHIKEQGFEALAAPTPMSERLDRAAVWHLRAG